MNCTEISDMLHHLEQPAYAYIAGAALVFALLLILLRRRQPRSVVAYSTENGRVLVSRSAIVELVRTSCQQIESVSKPHVRVSTKGKFTHFEVRINLTSGGRLKTIEQTLQIHLRRALTENLGIEHLGKINIIAIGFKSGRIALPKPTTTAESSFKNTTTDPADEIDNDNCGDEDFDTKSQ
jgi:hypothetical protein